MVSNLTLSTNHGAFYGHFLSNLCSFSNYTICPYLHRKQNSFRSPVLQVLLEIMVNVWKSSSTKKEHPNKLTCDFFCSSTEGWRLGMSLSIPMWVKIFCIWGENIFLLRQKFWPSPSVLRTIQSFKIQKPTVLVSNYK